MRENHASEHALDDLAADLDAVRHRGRQIYGIVGREERVPFGAGRRASGVGLGTLGALWLLVLADAAVLASALWTSSNAELSLGSVGPAVPIGLRPMIFFLGGVVAVWLVPKWGSRAGWAMGAAALQAVVMVAVAMSSATVGLVLCELLEAVVSGVIAAVALPLLIDTSRPEIRVRVAGGFCASILGGFGLSGVVVSVLEGLGLTWRAGLLVVAILPAAAAVAVAAARPGLADVGRFDRDRIRRLVDERLGAPVEQVDGAAFSMAAFTKAMLSFTSVRLLLSATAFGMALWGMEPYLDRFLRDRWGIVSESRGLIIPVVALVAIPAVLWCCAHLEAAFRDSPGRMIWRLSSAGSVTALALAVVVVSPIFALTAASLVIYLAAAGALFAGSAFLMLTVVEPGLRNAASVVLVGLTLIGGSIGGQLASSVGSRFGIAWAILVPALVILGWANTGPAARSVDGDLNAALGRQIEVEELSARTRLGQHLPLLSCKHVDFAYGQVQVLFDVSFTVDDGEMVALLGTNGAGKTTLLRLISGLAIPASGSIHYQGRDVTFFGADQRVGLGISQIPGGRAVFGPLTVADNLRAYGYTYGRRRSELSHAIEEVFAVLPKLHERRDQLASTLSGGEQQMLGVAKAFITRPRLLLIDELSLGLAPIVVAELLEMVRRINRDGTAVVLVEQSVNIALSLVRHAYFMEKGEIRFDGPAADLLDRSDLLRSVFLKGATKGLAGVEK